ncbi:hypothetical protein ACH5Y9_08815 [Methylomonas sp. BW4-1]|uniref:hypothetical protein n=1 Tax=Methylomonas sp. BW4-1 TaxID=3376685 RepID=UPI0040439434
MEELNRIFQSNLDGIAETLISLYDLKFEKEIDALSCPLTRWLDFRFRYIDPVPRQIVFSNAFPKKLPKTVEAGFQSLMNLIRSGADINPYQSKFISRVHDTSKKRKAERTDLLWADWGLFHLHITDVPLQKGEFYSERKCSDGECWLLFCLAGNSTFAVIDIREHNEGNVFTNFELIKIIEISWPTFMEQLLMKGILPSKTNPSSEQLSSLRRAGMAVPITLNGKAYIGPGLGYTMSATSLRVLDGVDRIRYWIKQVALLAENQEGQIQRHLKENCIAQPDLSLCITPNGLAIYEEKLDTAYALLNERYKDDRLTRLHNMLCPSWVLSRLG